MNKTTAFASQLNFDARLRSAVRWLADAERFSRLQQILLVIAVLWAINSASHIVLALMPNDDLVMPTAVPINPAPANTAASFDAEPIDVASILGADIFGSGAVSEAVIAPEVNTAINPRDGIENGARETRLALTLTGIVASTSDGLGSAMIEAKKQQALYSVGDALPANGKVTLAKILPQQVVIDNNGTYELITLFDDNALTGIVESKGAVTAAPSSTSLKKGPARSSVNAMEQERLASRYRQQLYNDPQSLAGLLSVSAVQGENGLRGYRVAPGRDAAQFTALGFESGDIVTAVNGYALSDPTNTVRLYQLMRDATDATFEVERDGATVSISVSLSAVP